MWHPIGEALSIRLRHRTWRPTAPNKCLVAYDWGGAVVWNFANQRPLLAKRLANINSPHPVTFLCELKNNPAQQQASGPLRG